VDRVIKYINCTHGLGYKYPTELTLKDIEKALLDLIGNDFEGYYSEPGLKDKFYAIIDEKVSNDLQHIPRFISVSSYGNLITPLEDELGAVGLVRFIKSKYSQNENSYTLTTEAQRPIYNIFFVKESDKNNTQILNLRCTLMNEGIK
jgi:N4-gp56 family major capsid protein